MRLNRLERFIGQITGHRARGRGFYNHVRAAEVKRMVGPDIWDGYFKFSVERNPWDRQVSLYYWRYPDAETRPPFEDFLTSRRWRKRVDNFKIYTLDGALAVDYMMRYESLGADFAAALEKIGISEPLSLAQAKGTSRAGGRDYRDYYTDETRELVGEWYKDEIALFGYAGQRDKPGLTVSTR